MTRIVIPLDTDERRALSLLAASELRDPRLQVRYMLRSELERRGLLDVQSESFPARVDPFPIPQAPTATAKHKTPSKGKSKPILTAN